MATENTMLAAFITETGPPDVIRTGQLPVPVPGPGEVLVRMEATTVNHVDLFIRSGQFPVPLEFPFIIGRDLTGTVVEAGGDSGKFSPGERMWTNSLGHGGRQGSFARYCVVEEDRLYPLPDGLDMARSVIVLHPAATAWLGLHREARIRAGDTLVVEGAGGAVGGAVLQMAARDGVRVLATASSADAEWCLESGAQTVLDYRLPDLYERLARLLPEGADVWWDCSGRQDLEQVLPLLRTGGRVIMMSGLGNNLVVPLPVAELYMRDLSVHGYAVSNASVADLQAAALEINQLLESGDLHGRIGVRLQLADAARAHELLESGALKGRIVVT